MRNPFEYGGVVSGDAFCTRKQELADLRRAILALPDEYREPIVLQVLGGFSTGEIAQELGLTVPAVLTRLFRARNKLREIYGVDPESPGETP